MSEQTINTRLIQRNDTAENWAAATTARLRPGEIGVETDTGLFKIGIADPSGTYEGELWSKLEYANEAQVRVVTSEANKGTGRKLGDMVIVETPLYEGSTQKTRTAYVWQEVVDDDGNKSEDWAALDGNYNADNVYFATDFTLAGDYEKIGNVKLSDSTLAASGKSLSQILTTIFTKELYPKKGTNRDFPTLSLSGDSDKSGEVGSSYELPTVTVTVSDVGSYTHGPATGIKFEVGDLVISQKSSSNSKSNTSEMVKSSTLSLKATDTATLYTDSAKSYTFSASGDYTAGVAPKTNLGNLLDNNENSDTWTYRIPAGTATATERTVKRTGYRNAFAGATTDATITSVTIRGLETKFNSRPYIDSKTPSDTQKASTAKEFYAYKGDTKAIFAYPSDWTGTPHFEMFTSAWGSTEGFKAQSNIQVADYRGTVDGVLQGPTAYKFYMWDSTAIPFEAEVTKFRVYFDKNN